ncbi:YybH family protein [Hymenobacter siberiensis]|jgi:ketosteroid isomerase-like protein|uniref:YybH family protein n=1 Tax=Hymenobacter siberiensis TaxID=2848396 RepID=UPI001C1E7327|nr:nuclear transport factor 2 family protein [Hymenobacter siberiensis]MBU6121769.1 nuclear transport factor 2 family protein [Hymenobacter siberiensis]
MATPNTILGLLACLAGTHCAAAHTPPKTSPEAARRAIVQVLTTQTAAWNRGDIPGFMQGYWQSDSLVFIGRKGPTYGWQPTLANYQKNYPDAAAMGKLDFSGLRVSLLAPSAAQVVGHWHLARPAALGDLQGYFLLVLRQIGGKWVVVADHTNSQ